MTRDLAPHPDVETLRRELEAARRLLVAMEIESRELREELARLKSSATGRMTARLQQRARQMAPYGSRRGTALHSVAQGAAVLVEQGPRALVQHVSRRRQQSELRGEFADTPAGRQRQYLAWLGRHEPRGEQLNALRAEEEEWRYRPLISLVMPVCDPEPGWLEEAILSVQAQLYPNWELCIADDASARPEVRATLARFADADKRINVRFRDGRDGIAATSNDALAVASGEWVGFVDHDDVLRPHALHVLVRYLQEHGDTGVCYSDEDKILPSGQRGDPLFKPDWAPEMLLSANYITHFVIVRRQLLEIVGGFREGYDGSQDHDLLLRVTERDAPVAHIPEVLYSWRMGLGSAALSSDFKPMAREAGRRAVDDALKRRGAQARVEFGTHPGFYNIRYRIEGSPAVAIVIPTRDRVDLLRAAIRSIEQRSTYSNYTIVIVNNQSTRAETLQFLRETRHHVVDYDSPFNFSAIVNAAAASTDAEHLLLFNNDVEVVNPGWMEAMLMHSQRAEVGASGARLVYADGRVQHEGIVVGRLHEAANVEMGWPGVREVSAVTGACMMTRRSVFAELGGFDESLAEAFNDVDYCLRARRGGYRVIFTPLAELLHREGASRGRRIPAQDRARFIERWGDRDQIEDPYLNFNVLWPNPLRLRMD